MDGSPTPGAASTERALALFTAIAEDGDGLSLSAHAERLGIPASTAHRLVDVLQRHGLVARTTRGHYIAGLRLAEIGAKVRPIEVVVAVARPAMRRLAKRYGTTVHLGILENDMVTYVAKEHGGGGEFFTREGGQLEAYCSAIGKVLLAALPPPERERYLAAGPFIALTERTQIMPEDIRQSLDRAARSGFATDDREVADDIQCVAVPVRRSDGSVVAGLSLSVRSTAPVTLPAEALLACAAEITARIG